MRIRIRIPKIGWTRPTTLAGAEPKDRLGLQQKKLSSERLRIRKIAGGEVEIVFRGGHSTGRLDDSPVVILMDLPQVLVMLVVKW